MSPFNSLSDYYYLFVNFKFEILFFFNLYNIPLVESNVIVNSSDVSDGEFWVTVTVSGAKEAKSFKAFVTVVASDVAVRGAAKIKYMVQHL